MKRLLSNLWVIGVAILTAGLCSCNGADFGGGQGSPSPSSGDVSETPETPANPTPVTPRGTPEGECDAASGKLKYPEQIQGCIDEGKLYHFDTETCTSTRKSSWQCSFDQFINEMERLRFDGNVPFVESAQGENAVLIGCGESSDGRTIVAQWWYPPEGGDECEFKAGVTKIVSACYRQFVGEAPPSPTTDDEKREFVLSCMTDNQE